MYWPERSPADFEAYGTTGRKVVDRTTGELYVRVEHDPFQSERPEADLITCFVQNGGWLWFLKPYGVGNHAGVGLDAATFGGEVRQDRKTLRPILVDAIGRRVKSRLVEGKR